MSGRKPTRAESDGIIEFVQPLVARGLRKSLIKKAFGKMAAEGQPEYGVGPRQIEEYISRAIKANAVVAAKPKKWWGDFITLQMAADMNDPKATKGDRARTAVVICKMKGLYAPLQHEHSGHDGEPIKIKEVVVLEDANFYGNESRLRDLSGGSSAKTNGPPTADSGRPGEVQTDGVRKAVGKNGDGAASGD